MLTTSKANTNLSLLGTEAVNCRWIKMSDGVWYWVCFKGAGGGGASAVDPNNPAKTLRGDEFVLKSAAELATMTGAQLIAYRNELNTRIAYMENEIATGNYSADAIAGFRAAILQFRAEVASVTAALNNQLSSGQITNETTQNIDAYQSGQNYLNQASFFDSLSTPIFGIPAWMLAAGVIGVIALTNK